MKGFHCYDPPAGCNDGTLTLPILEYGHNPSCAVIGGSVYRGSSIPQLYGVYFYGDYCSGIVWGAIRDCSGSWSTTRLLDSPYNISSFGEDESGEIYLTDLGGAVYRIAATPDHLAPSAAALSPSVAIAGDPGFTLTVDGSGFDGGSVVRWNGADRPTTLVCPTRLAAAIPASDLSTSGTATVTVFNPAPASGTVFLDVPANAFGAAWIEAIAAAGITGGCGGGNFCPAAAVSRAQAAVFLVKAFNLP